MGIIDWLISHSGAIVIFIAVVLVIIISWYVYSRRRLLKTANEPENIGKPESTEKPEIIVFLRPHASRVQCLMLCIKNIGTGTAYNVRFGTRSFRPPSVIAPSSNLSDVNILKENSFLQNGIGCFGPGQKIEQFLISLIEELPEELKHPLQINVTYSDLLNHPYENRYALDFSNFESLAQIDRKEEKATSDLSPLLHAMQTDFRQVAESIDRLSPPQTEKPKGSETPSQEEEKPLSPALQQFVALYNADDNAKLQQIYESRCSIYVSNETALFQDPNTPPIFQTTSNGSFVAYPIDSENLYAVVPFSGCILQNDLYNSGAFGKVFECPGFDPEHTYYVKVIRPAFFKRDPVNEKWTLEEKGKLELKEKDH